MISIERIVASVSILFVFMSRIVFIWERSAFFDRRSWNSSDFGSMSFGRFTITDWPRWPFSYLVTFVLFALGEPERLLLRPPGD